MIGWVLGILVWVYIAVLLGVMVLGVWSIIKKRRSKRER